MSRRWRRLGRLALDTSRRAVGRDATRRCRSSNRSTAIAGRSISACATRTGARASAAPCSTMTGTPALAPLDPDPVLDLGPLGAFDDSGVTTSCLVSHGSRRLLYYTGWSRGVTVPFYLAAGLAVSDRRRTLRAAVAGAAARSLGHRSVPDRVALRLDRGRALAHVVRVGDRVARATPSGPRHYYNIRYAESADGVALDARRHRLPRLRDARTSTPSRGRGSCATPTAIACGSRCAVRYEIGARRVDRRPALDAPCRPAGCARPRTIGTRRWWSTRCIFARQGRRYMLYNGNGYGAHRRRTGGARPLAGGQIGRWLHGRREGEAGASRPRRGRAAHNAHVGAPSRARDGTEKSGAR